MHHHYQHIAFCLTTGQPYNQLAILASGKGDELATVYYYCRRCVKIIIKDTVNCKKILQKIQIVTCVHTKTSNKSSRIWRRPRDSNSATLVGGACSKHCTILARHTISTSPTGDGTAILPVHPSHTMV